jgi:hypothetical protein
MPDEPSLREKAREAISNGGLPRQRPNRMFGGAGTGGPCALCGESIPQTGAEIEIEFNRHGATPGLDRYRLHYRCFTAWESERVRLEGKS